MTLLTKRDILRRYAPNRYGSSHVERSRQDSPCSFYTWQETQVMMGGKSRPSPPISLNTDYRLVDRSDRLADAIAPLKSAPFIGIDCETTGLDPYRHKVRLIQLAALDRPTIVIDCFAIPDLAPLRSLLSSPCLKIGHNLKFEWLMLTRRGLSLQPPFFDTYLAYRVLTAGLKKRLSLEAIAMKLLGIPLDKTEQTSDFSGTLTPKQLQYAAMDAAILLPLYRIVKAKLERAKLMPTAKLEFACLPATAQMELNGMYLDREKWEAMGDRLKQQQARLKTQLDRQLKRPPTQQVSLLPELTETINPRSSQQVKAALAAQNILVPSASAQQLLPLAKKHPIIQTLLDYRSLSARISTFAEGVLEHIHLVSDRIHPNWFQLGTRSGRFSCQQPNLQHIPRAVEIRQCFVAPPGKVLIKADYSQIELRIMAKAAYGRNTCKIGHPVKFCKDGTFTSDYAGKTKRLRSMKLTDTAWELLAEIAEKNKITRTEVIELFARGED